MATLKSRILDAQKNGDIATLYVMEQTAQEELGKTDLSGYYRNLLDLALERLGEALTAPRKMQMHEVQDFATLRALYEYAIEHYSAGKNRDAAALFEVLAGISDDAPFSEAMQTHRAWSKQLSDFETFLQTVADLDATQQRGTFYISVFKHTTL